MYTDEPNAEGQVATRDIIVARPPDGWENRTNNHSSRWAWDNEAKSPLEENLAPVIVPKNWVWKFSAIMFLTWIVSIYCVLAIFLCPIIFGRSIQTLLRIPTRLRHDPVSFIIGVIAIAIISKLVSSTFTQEFQNFKKNLFSKNVFYPCNIYK